MATRWSRGLGSVRTINGCLPARVARAFQTPITIQKALGAIERREYVLPAIQREFVWWPEQIECLFDSLMQGYPIGSFLFWMVRREGIEKYKFYDFMLDYHERDNAHCASVRAVTRDEISAVLDGQQRLTALNIWLRSSYADKLPRLWWGDVPCAVETQRQLGSRLRNHR